MAYEDQKFEGDLQLEGRAVFCSRAGTELNSQKYQQFVRSGYPHLITDMTERSTTQEQRLTYGCIHYVGGRSR
jgi:hypothetical protein